MKSNWIVGMVWVSGFSIGAVLIGALCLAYFDRQRIGYDKADRDELLTEIKYTVAQATAKKPS